MLYRKYMKWRQNGGIMDIYSIIEHRDGPTAYFYAGKVGTAGNSGAGGFDFIWNWINVFGLIIILLLLLPNIIYAIKYKSENLCENRFMNILEQVGRYGSMLFMVVCLKNGGYGFSSVGVFLIYCFGNLLLLISYWIVWGIYFHMSKTDSTIEDLIEGKHEVKKIGILKMSLAVLPSCLFLLDGITLEYIPLLIFAILFAFGHIYVTYQNVRG